MVNVSASAFLFGRHSKTVPLTGGQCMTHDRSTIEAVVQNYFDALYEGDARGLSPLRGFALAGKGRVERAARARLARSRPQAALRQGRRQATRGFCGHDRPLRRIHRLYQGALPIAAALFHRLPGGDETERRLADCLEIVSLRSEAIAIPIPRH